MISFIDDGEKLELLELARNRSLRARHTGKVRNLLNDNQYGAAYVVVVCLRVAPSSFESVVTVVVL